MSTGNISGSVVELMREFKALQARKKAGESLTPDEDERRKALRAYLRGALAKQAPGRAKTAPTPKPAPQEPASAPPTSASPTPTPKTAAPQQAASQTAAAPLPQPVAAPPPQPVAPPQPASAPVTQAVAQPAPASQPAAAKPAGAVLGRVQTKSVQARKLPEPLSTPRAKSGYVPKADAFAIKGAGVDALFAEANASEAVNKVAPGVRQAARATDDERRMQAEKAENAAALNKTRPRARNADEAAEQLSQVAAGSSYTAGFFDAAYEDYYGEYADEGYAFIPSEQETALQIAPIDPRELELYKAGLAGTDGDTVPVPVPDGLAFIDDFPVLYQMSILPPPDEDAEPDLDDPNLIIRGKRKVTVHMLRGQIKRGVVRKLGKSDMGFTLLPQGTGQSEDLSIAQLKAVFVHRPSRHAAEPGAGRSITVTFQDGRSVQGMSEDYQPGAAMFTLVPPPGRGQFERIIVNAQAVRAVR